MRIIAGVLKGRRLRAPRGSKVRPTADRVKESLFNMLADRTRDAMVLDLFAGAGSLGLEALSRGARSVVFAERDPVVARSLWANVEALGCQEHARLLRVSADRAIATASGTFDLVFLDPPYESGLAAATLAAIGASTLVAQGGTVVAEHSRREEVPDAVGSLHLDQQRRFGDTVLSLYARR